MRFVGLALVATALAGCSQAPKPQISEQQTTQYIALVKSGRAQCYVRYFDALAIDSVCIDGNDIRYAEPPSVPIGSLGEVPAVAMALFSRTKPEDVLLQRRDLQQASTAAAEEMASVAEPQS